MPDTTSTSNIENENLAEKNTDTSKSSIDFAIMSCDDKIRHHRIEGNKILMYVMVTLLFFGTILFFQFYSNANNEKKLSNFIEEVNINSERIDKQVMSFKKASSDLQRYLVIDTPFQKSRQQSYSDPNFDVRKYLSTILSDDYAVYDSVTKNLKRLPLKFENSIFHIDTTAVYILYGIFLLVFGVLTSFYRFHLKEISKYEHFLFGFQRIRIAGDNSESGYDAVIKSTLTRNAFVMEHKSLITKEKKFESPIPGHYTSDIGAAMVNKIMEAIEITTKSKKTGNT